MARIILTTCGTSLFHSSSWNWGTLNNRPLSGTTDSIERRRRQINCERAIINAKNEDPTGEQLAITFDVNSWNLLEKLRDLPAELASLKAIKMYFEDKKINQPLAEEDKIVLLHSDNSQRDIDGKFCADVLKMVIINNNLLSPVSRENIETVEIRNLDPADRERFSEALIGVWNYTNELKRGGNIIILNLTGGYKALAILLGAFGNKFQGIPMFYLHEEAGYDQIFMMKFENDRPVFSYYNASSKEIITYNEGIGGP